MISLGPPGCDLNYISRVPLPCIIKHGQAPEMRAWISLGKHCIHMPSDLQEELVRYGGAVMDYGGRGLRARTTSLRCLISSFQQELVKALRRQIPHVRDVSCFMKIALVT